MEDNFDLSPEVVNNNLSFNYTGENDVYLDFQGNKGDRGSFVKMQQSTRRVSFKVKNSTDGQKIIAITPANFKTEKSMLVIDDSGTLKVRVPGGGLVAVTEFDENAVANDIISANSNPIEMNKAGLEVDAVLDDGIIYAEASDPTKNIKVTAGSPRARVSHFLRFLNGNPTAGIGFHISSTDVQMYETDFVSQNVTPYRGVGQEDRIPFQDEFNQLTQNDKKIVKSEYFQLDGETFSKMVFPANSTVSVTLVFSVVQSQAHALRIKSNSVKINGKRIKRQELILGKPKYVPGT